MHYVYILESEQDISRWYVGVTSNLKRRILEHDNGESIHTARFRPWRLKTYTAFTDRKKAEDFEKYLKSHSGRAFTKKRL